MDRDGAFVPLTPYFRASAACATPGLYSLQDMSRFFLFFFFFFCEGGKYSILENSCGRTSGMSESDKVSFRPSGVGVHICYQEVTPI